MIVEFTHRELNLMLFALDRKVGGGSGGSCEDACPIADNLDRMFRSESVPREKVLVNHLNNHLRESLIESGMLEIMAESNAPDSLPQPGTRLEEVNRRLEGWRCRMKLEESDRAILFDVVSHLPRSAWLSMPLSLWRLRKKLKE